MLQSGHAAALLFAWSLKLARVDNRSTVGADGKHGLAHGLELVVSLEHLLEPFGRVSILFVLAMQNS